jgi:death-on-curing family protein
VKNKTFKSKLVIYQAKSGAIELKGDFTRETLWATQAQIAEVFGVNVRTISEHLINIFKSGELEQASVVRNFRNTASDGKSYDTKFYSLDAILSVGYRVNSKTATEFRKWATKTLKEHIIKGYTLNKKVILKNYDQFLKNISDIQALLPAHMALDPKSILDLVKEYSTTWTKLDAYDRDTLVKIGTTKKKIKLTGGALLQAIFELRSELIKKSEATEIFAQERDKGNIEGIVGNIMQSFAGNDVYETLEEKAAHLLYFIVKNHPFVDGNKRSGAFAFVWFLRRCGVKGAHNINPSGLTAITLLIAESDPKHKDKMVALVVELLRINKK